MRVLTVRQPWAWAIIHGGKDVENRVRNVAGSYRGPVAIHVSKSFEDVWPLPSPLLAAHKLAREDDGLGWFERGAYLANDAGHIIGVVDLVGVHDSRVDGCGTRKGAAKLGELIPVCSEWAEPWAHHLVLANPRPLAEPILFRGALGLRTLPEDVEAAVWSGVS
jgi:hypothetical protein